MTGNLNMNGNKITGLGLATADGDAVSLAKLTDLKLLDKTNNSGFFS
jgi:hypothetical protein